VTLALCVKPPVAGAPVPYIPVKLSLYVALGVFPLVLRTPYTVAELDPVKTTEVLDNRQVELGGTPPQDNATVPVNPPSGVIVIV